jgi:phosphopantetheine adenylyltransferase
MNPSFLRKYDERLQRLEEQIKALRALCEPRVVDLHLNPAGVAGLDEQIEYLRTAAVTTDVAKPKRGKAA